MRKENKEEKKKLLRMKELVLARLEIASPKFILSVGNQGTFSKEQLIEHVRKGDNIGIQIIEMQLKFIKALTSGRLIETLNK